MDKTLDSNIICKSSTRACWNNVVLLKEIYWRSMKKEIAFMLSNVILKGNFFIILL